MEHSELDKVSGFWKNIDQMAADAPDSPYSHAKVKELLRVAWKQKEIIAQQQTALQEAQEEIKLLEGISRAADEACEAAQREQLKQQATLQELAEALRIYEHAHTTGNSVPSDIVKQARAALAKAAPWLRKEGK